MLAVAGNIIPGPIPHAATDTARQSYRERLLAYRLCRVRPHSELGVMPDSLHVHISVMHVPIIANDAVPHLLEGVTGPFPVSLIAVSDVYDCRCSEHEKISSLIVSRIW